MTRDGRLRALALSAVVAAAALSFATPGEARPDPDRALDSPAALPGAVAREDDCDNAMVAADIEQSPKRLIGQVTSLDHRGGQLILATRSGSVALPASPETIHALQVGDVIVLELTPEPDAMSSRGDCP